ncbi:MAG: OmpA family protein [Pseudomonadota bacterium]
MRCNPWRWLWGLPLVAMWVCISGLIELERIQNDLQSRSQAALIENGFSWASPAFGYREGLVAGTAPSNSIAAQALDTVRSVWGVRSIDGAFEAFPVISDYVWKAQRQPGRPISLTGYAPSSAVRQSIVKAVQTRFPNTEVRDKLAIARGAPPDDVWLNGVTFGLSQLALLSDGTLTLRNTGLSLAGRAATSENYRLVKGALGTGLPNGFSLVRDAVSAPVVRPYTWSAVMSGAQIVLSGHAPSANQRKAVFDAAKAAFPVSVIVDRMNIGAGEPSDFVAAASSGLAALKELQNGSVEMTDLVLLLKGQAADQIVGKTLADAFRRGVPENFEARADLTYARVIPPLASPFDTNIDVKSNMLILTGFVPSPEARKLLTDMLKQRFPDRRIDDQLELASGQPEAWQACLDAGLDGLARLNVGTIAMRDATMRLRGKTDDEALAGSLPGQVRAAANRACQTEVDLVVDTPPEPNLTWRAVRGEDGVLALEGQVPDAATRAKLVERAGDLFPKLQVRDRMRITGGAARKWQQVALTGLAALSQLRNGEATITGQELLVRGEAANTAIAGAVNDQLQFTLSKGYRGRDIVSVRSAAMIWAQQEAERKAKAKAEADRLAAEAAARERAEREQRQRAEAEALAKAEAEARRKAEIEQQRLEAEARELAKRQREEEARRVAALEVRKAAADRCQSLLRSANAAGAIRFAFASSNLDSRSFGTLDELVSIARSCPDFRIEIEGHTDAEGRPDLNLRLSQRRAQSVFDYLVKAGVNQQRLSAIGYGETRPVAPNTTAQNRARNRRIEFSVKVN